MTAQVTTYLVFHNGCTVAQILGTPKTLPIIRAECIQKYGAGTTVADSIDCGDKPVFQKISNGILDNLSYNVEQVLTRLNNMMQIQLIDAGPGNQRMLSDLELCLTDIAAVRNGQMCSTCGFAEGTNPACLCSGE